MATGRDAAWHYVVGELTAQKVALYAPLAQSGGADLLARVGDGRSAEVQIASAGTLTLDEPADEPLRERLAVYRNRWSLIADFAKYRSTLDDPVSLRMQLMLE